MCRIQVCSIVHDLDLKGQNLNVWAFLQAWLSTFYTLGCMWPTSRGEVVGSLQSGSTLWCSACVVCSSENADVTGAGGTVMLFILSERSQQYFFLGTFSPSQMVSLNSPDWPRTCSVDQAQDSQRSAWPLSTPCTGIKGMCHTWFLVSLFVIQTGVEFTLWTRLPSFCLSFKYWDCRYKGISHLTRLH